MNTTNFAPRENNLFEPGKPNDENLSLDPENLISDFRGKK